jgi:excisionase family DNA binding protein
MEPPKIPRTKTAHQVATQFGVSLATLYRWRSKGVIQGTRVGHFLLFTESEIDRFSRERYAGLIEDDQDQVAS